jgi:LmbE family N-acetylglucosaminyl deacetylase
MTNGHPTDRPLTLMAVHAHPDDEATGTGGILARYAAEGIETVLVVCTDGAAGDGPGGVKPGEPGHDRDAVVAMRRSELEASCAALKVGDLEMLGYADSGMMGWENNDAPGSFWTTPVDEAAARLADLMRRYRPDVVVTYDENGFYGHPDHIQAHRVTMAAVASTGIPAKVYWTTAPRSMIQKFGQLMREYGMEWDEPDHSHEDHSHEDHSHEDHSHGDDSPGDHPHQEPEMEIGLPDEQITTWVDTTEFGGQKYDALAAHASQSDNIVFLRMGKERFTELMGMETFVRVQDNTDAPLPEDDLFAGLR